ncbi:MAG: sulfite oxidase [Isosphaeraceae bacterium]
MALPETPRPVPDRRSFLAGAATSMALARSALAWRSVDDDPGGMILRSSRPLDLEVPVHRLDSYLTPADRLFVRSHLGEPAVELLPWRIELGGDVRSPKSWTLEDLSRFERVTTTAVIQCAGNGRSFFRPSMPGIGWERGAVANAEWSGVRLRDLLEAAGIGPEAAHIHLLGADLPPHVKTPVFLRSIPRERAFRDEVILATHVNGEPIPKPNGGPVRLVVPGWFANHWMKWVRRISAEPRMADGFYMQTAYRIPKVPVPPGVDVKPEDLDYVTSMNVKSLITSPRRDSTAKAGPVEIRGVAWTGDEGRIAKVEVAWIDGGRWHEAELIGPDRPFAWRTWRLAADLPGPGPYAIRSRAADTRGQVQPESTPWNKSGYLWNAIDRVPVEVAG